MSPLLFIPRLSLDSPAPSHYGHCANIFGLTQVDVLLRYEPWKALRIRPDIGNSSDPSYAFSQPVMSLSKES